MQVDRISLLELNQHIKKLVKDNKQKYWIVAEISELKVNYSGHCYLELIQKDEKDDQIIARSRATIWSSTYRMVKAYFETTTNQPLTEGLSVMIKVTIDFHEVYGLSLNVLDIEPSFTVGELAVRKQKIIRQLTEEGVIEMNRELLLPAPCQRIAVISSKTAAGFEDFTDQLLQNSYGYRFYMKLFPAVMQGAEAEKSIIGALERIYRYADHFDAVVIIRGGGSQADLSCFNNYWLAYHITQFPLPVLTGIGHEQDDSVTDLVAHTRLKTPTAAAAFLIDRMAELDSELQYVQQQIAEIASETLRKYLEELSENAADLQNAVIEHVRYRSNQLTGFQHKLNLSVKRELFREHINLNRLSNTMDTSGKAMLRQNKQELEHAAYLLKSSSRHFISDNARRLEFAGERTTYLDPKQVLKRGYSITLKDNKAMKNADTLRDDDVIETILFRGKVKSIVKNK